MQPSAFRLFLRESISDQKILEKLFFLLEILDASNDKIRVKIRKDLDVMLMPHMNEIYIDKIRFTVIKYVILCWILLTTLHSNAIIVIMTKYHVLYIMIGWKIIKQLTFIYQNLFLVRCYLQFNSSI